MMFLDKKGKFFGKVSIVDVCVILVIVIGFLGAVFTFSTLNSGKLSDNSKLALNSSRPVQEATVTFELKAVREMTKDSLREGDEIYETEDDIFIGTITKVTSKPATKEFTAKDGTFYTSEIPKRYDVEVTVDVLGKETQTGFHTESGFQILYGKEVEIKTPYVKTKPEITGIAIKNTGE